MVFGRSAALHFSRGGEQQGSERREGRKRARVMTDHHWWTLRHGTTIVYLEWGQAHGALFGTDFKMHKGPPVTFALNLDRNFRTRSTKAGTYRDAEELAHGGLRELRRVQISDEHISLGLDFLLQHTEEASPPWRLLLELRGETHEFHVEPDIRAAGNEHDLLVLRVRTST
jgi:hypothetical protein